MKQKATITQRALFYRLQRSLASQGEMLRKDRRTGQYMLIDTRKNCLISNDVDLEEMARASNVLAVWERVEN